MKITPPRSKYADVCTTSNPYDVVMTPPHIAHLMAKLANPQPDSVILDITCGTGNLLAACQQGQLVGIEQEPYLLSLCRENLPETAQIYGGDCFEYEHVIRRHKPTIGLLNPPYSKEGKDTQAYKFMDYLLDCLTPGGSLKPLRSMVVTVSSTSM